MILPEPPIPRWKMAAELARMHLSRQQIANLMGCSVKNVDQRCVTARNHGEYVPRRVRPKGSAEVPACLSIEAIDRKIEALAVAVDKLCERDPCTAAALLDVREDLQRVRQFELPSYLRAAMVAGI